MKIMINLIFSLYSNIQYFVKWIKHNLHLRFECSSVAQTEIMHTDVSG